MSQNKEKQFAKNTIILSIGTISSRIFSFFLLPLYTNVLTTEDYGNVDYLQSIISLAIPIFTLQLSAAVFRFLIDEQGVDDKRVIISSASVIVVVNTLIFVTVTICFYKYQPFPHVTLFILTFIASLLYLMVQNVVRAFGHNGLYSFCSFISVFVSVLVNLLLILKVGLKGESILIAIIVSQLVASFIMIVRDQLWIYFSFHCFSYAKLREMLYYSIPLILNEISWWIASLSDRFLIIRFLGPASNGIYASANKIPSLYTTIHNVFNLAWNESAARAINDLDRDQYYNNMISVFYHFFGCLILMIITAVSIAFKYLYGPSYADAYPHIIILLLAIFINSLCATYGGIFSALKESKAIGFTTTLGAVVNIVINISFIKTIGLYAASISTLVSYFTILIIRAIKIRQYVEIHIPVGYITRFIIALLISGFCYFFNNTMLSIILLLLLMIWSMLENKLIVIGFAKALRRFINLSF